LFAALGALGPVSLSSGRPAAAEQREPRAAIQSQYDRFNASLVGKNIAALARLCTADCKFKMRPDGPAVSLDQFRQTTTASFRSMNIKRAGTRIDSFAVSGNDARVKATWTADLVSMAADKKRHRVHSIQKLDDTWTKTPGGWLLQSSTVASTQ